MKLRFAGSVCLLAVVLLIICFSTDSQAWPWSKKKDESRVNLPLYESPDGWQIWKAYFGSELTEGYRNYLSLNGTSTNVPAEILYVYEKGDGFFLGFTMRIHDPVITYWDPTSEITVTYTAGKDTLQLASTQIFFSNPLRTKLIFTYELSGAFPVSSNTVSVTKKGDPVVFARFPFSKVPDRILTCTVKNVRSNMKEVSRR